MTEIFPSPRAQETVCVGGSACAHQEQALLLTPARTQGEFFNLMEAEFPSLPCCWSVLDAQSQVEGQYKSLKPPHVSG